MKKKVMFCSVLCVVFFLRAVKSKEEKWLMLGKRSPLAHLSSYGRYDSKSDAEKIACKFFHERFFLDVRKKVRVKSQFKSKKTALKGLRHKLSKLDGVTKKATLKALVDLFGVRLQDKKN